MLGGGQAAGEVGRPDTGHLAPGQVQRIDDDERQPGPGESGEVTLAYVVDDIDHGRPAELDQFANPGGGPLPGGAFPAAGGGR